MANTDAELRIGGNIDELKAATDKATAEVKRMADQMQSSLGSLNSAFQKIHGTFMAFTAVIAGGAAFKGVINASNDWALESGKLGKALGITTEQASVMKVALNHIGVESDVLINASQKMSKQIFSNGAAFETMGVQVKDTAGNYRPVMDVMGEANEKLLAIKNPIAQNIAGMQLYGRSWSEIKPILKLTAEVMADAEARAKALHLIVGPEGEAQAKAYKSQMRDVNLVGKSLEIQFGNALTPVFVKLGSWMGQEAPRMGEIFKNVLLGVSAAAQTVWEVINGLGNALGGFAAMVAAVLHGDLGGAKAIYAEMEADNQRTATRVKDIWAHAFETPPQAKSAAHDLSGPSPDFGKDGASAADKSRVGAWESQLAEAKVFYQKQYELREYSKSQEIEYWQSILRLANVTGQERIAVTRKVAELELEVMKKKLQQQKDLGAEAINAHEKAADDGLKMEELLADREYQLGNISKTQLITLQQQYEDRRAAIQEEAQAARITALLGDPNMDPVALQKLLDQMAEIHRAHDLRIAKLNSDAAIESKNKWEQMLAPISNAFEKSITGMIQGTLTLQKALRNIFNAILGEFISMTVKMGMKWAAMELAKTADTKKGSVLRSVLEKMGLIESSAAQVTASTTTAAAKKAEAVAVIPAEAAEAAGAAASAVAGIPIVGPALAAAAFAETMAMVMGGLAVASAAHGFDIPSGVNPMTQLHEQEMVLPAEHANTIRQLSAGGGGTGDTNLYVQAVDAASVERLFRDNGHLLARELRRQSRNFAPTNA